MMTPAHPIILILGPTAGGKTELALQLAERLPGGGTCLCCDSMQVYRGMDIGTAKPSPAERARVRHMLFDIADPAEDGLTVHRWLDLAEEAIATARRANRWPIVVGGTNLYVKALLEGLFDAPQPDPDLRAQLEAMPAEARRAELESLDPDAAERIHPADHRRTIRALEVCRTTGRPISDWQQQWDLGRVREDVRIVGLVWPVELINRRINERVRQMMAAGLLDEVRALHTSGRLGRQARAALGYAQLIDHLEGRCTLDAAVEQIKIRSRRYAKQQRTWLRRFRAYPSARWFEMNGEGPDEIVRIAEHVADWVSSSPSAPG